MDIYLGDRYGAMAHQFLYDVDRDIPIDEIRRIAMSKRMGMNTKS